MRPKTMGYVVLDSYGYVRGPDGGALLCLAEPGRAPYGTLFPTRQAAKRAKARAHGVPIGKHGIMWDTKAWSILRLVEPPKQERKERK